MGEREIGEREGGEGDRDKETQRQRDGGGGGLNLLWQFDVDLGRQFCLVLVLIERLVARALPVCNRATWL